MKKILTGILFRFFRSIETWVLVVLLLVATAYISYVEYVNTNNEFISDHSLTRYEELDVTVYDVYAFGCETLPEDTFNTLLGENVCAFDESELVFSILNDIPMVPVILMAIFIPVFFGRLFSDGTIKNLISSGHSRSRIYLASMLFSFVLNFIALVLNTSVYAIWCLILKWHPPVYLPVILVMLLIDLLLSFTISSWCLAVLFISKKRTLAFVASFLLAMSMFIYPTAVPETILLMTESINVESEDLEKIRKANEEAPYAFEEYFDLSQFSPKYRYKGETLSITMDSSLPDGVRKALLLWIYSDPELIMHFGESISSFSPYVFYRDGLMTINVASNVIWIFAGNLLGVALFKKREIK